MIYLANSGDATCLNLPSVQMCECACQSVGVCVSGGEQTGFTAHLLSNLLHNSHNTPANATSATQLSLSLNKWGRKK